MSKKEKIADFNWAMYENWNGKTLKPNPNITSKNPSTKVYSREPYAQELLDVYDNPDNKFIKKDLNKGDLVTVVDIPYIDESGKMIIEILGGLTIEIDLKREKKFLSLFDYNTVEDFVKSLQSEENKKDFINKGISAYIIESNPNLKVSLFKGHIIKTESVFLDEIKHPTQAYMAKVIEANTGGFFVELQGIRAFMPGSLAAPNKIIDFQSYLGKEVIVMIEDYLQEIKSFIVSHKKYIEYILPSKIKELQFTKKYKGSVTGTSKFGIFIEFEDIFTGLLHTSKMSEETKQRFRRREIKPGDEMEFWISEIAKDNRIILSEEDPIEKQEKLNQFLIDHKDIPMEGKVVSIFPFGVMVQIEEFIGIIPNKELKNKKFKKGDTVDCALLEIKENNKLYFKLF